MRSSSQGKCRGLVLPAPIAGWWHRAPSVLGHKVVVLQGPPLLGSRRDRFTLQLTLRTPLLCPALVGRLVPSAGDGAALEEPTMDPNAMPLSRFTELELVRVVEPSQVLE